MPGSDSSRPLLHRSRSAPILLDLYCCAGGMTKGYQRAGFYVVGVDKDPQPHYCGDEFHQADALEVLRLLLSGETWQGYKLEDFAAVHASPPCQKFTHARHLGNRGRDDHPNLIGPTRELLQAAGLPYVIENVDDARGELRGPVRLCGSAFGLDVQRHRLFETSFMLLAPGCQHDVWTERKYPGTPRADGSRPLSKIVNPMASGITHDVFAAAMGIDWMPANGRKRPSRELCEAIPPAYSEFIGDHLMRVIGAPSELAA